VQGNGGAGGADFAEVTGCKVLGTSNHGIFLDGGLGHVVPIVNDNKVQGAASFGIVVGPATNGIIKGNSIINPGGEGMSVTGTGGMIIDGNVISGAGQCCGGSYGLDVGLGTNYCIIMHNTVIAGNGSTVSGMVIYSDGNIMLQNELSKNAGHGIIIQGTRNLLDGNVIEDNGTAGTVYGIDFLNTGNAYRNNMLRGNRSGAVGGFSNTDAGGNIL